MAAALARAPTLAWLLTALACFLSGMALSDGRDQPGAPLPAGPLGVIVTVSISFEPTHTPAPTPLPTLTPVPTPTPPGPPPTPREGGTGNVR